MNTHPEANVVKLITDTNYEFFCNKLECLLLASLSSLVYCLWARSRVEHLRGVSLG